MQRIQRDPRIKLLTYFVIVAFVTSLGALGWPRPAEAQVGEVTAVAVLPLTNKVAGNKYGGPARGKVAADAVALALEESHQYQVIPQTDVDAQMVQMGLQPPLSELQMVRLGRALGVQGMVRGWINKIEVSQRARKATVSLRIEILDVDLEAYLNGAVGEVTTPARPGSAATDDELINEAFRSAAQTVVRTMVARRTPEGTVLIVDDLGEATLNLGAQEGLKANQTLITIHPIYIPELKQVHLRKVGTMRVSEVNPHTATAVRHTGVAPQTEDRFRVLYQPPKMVQRGKRKKAFGRGKTLLWGGLALAGLFAMVGGRHRSSASSDGKAALAQHGNGATPVIFLQLDNPSIPRPEEIICRVIHRWYDYSYFDANGYTIEAVLPYGNQLLWEDSPTAPDINIVDQETPEYTLNFVDSGGDVAQATCTVTFTHVPLQPGRQYWYRVQNVTVPQLPPGSNPPSGGATKSTRGRLASARQIAPGEAPSIEADPQDEGPMIQQASKPFPENGIMYLIPPTLVSPTETDLQGTDEVEFVWDATPGADEYRIEVFQGTQTTGNPIAQRTVAFTGQTQFRERITFSPQLPQSTWFTWRVGCRKSGDPLPNSLSGAGGPTGGPYIYSSTLFFGTVPSPPWPPQATTMKPAAAGTLGGQDAVLTRPGKRTPGPGPRRPAARRIR